MGADLRERFTRRIALFAPFAFPSAFLGALLACSVGTPTVGGDHTGEDAGPRYADSLIALYANGTLTEDCSQSLPDCAAGTSQPDPCGVCPAIGPPDGMDLQLDDNDSVELGFYCDGFIVSQPGDGGDLVVYGTPSPGTGVVEVSEDGTTFLPVGVFTSSPQSFSLSASSLDQAKYVRITGQGMGIGVDAVEAL